jgi:DNA-binding MarR family transcriptional regulator/predicted GNAT family acetyltransferase
MVGQMALGSRLRRLADVLTSDAEKVYELYGVDIDPRWFPAFYMLSVKGSAGITELAEDIGQTHPAVSQVVKKMINSGLVETQRCRDDARVSKVSLTPKGENIAVNLVPQCEDVNKAINTMFDNIGSSLWSEIEAVEHELDKKGLYQRVSDIRKLRESAKVDIVAYSPKYQQVFKSLNQNWIEKYWAMEPSDHKALDSPEQNIIGKGGYIAIAICEHGVVGTCALINMGEGSFELAKMAVDESAKGKGVGSLLGYHVIDQAKSLGARRIYLESNTVLVSALNLYRKLGFKRISGQRSPYERCNIQMELLLNDCS